MEGDVSETAIDDIGESVNHVNPDQEAEGTCFPLLLMM